MIPDGSPSGGRLFRQLTIDLLCWLVALLLGIAVEGFVVLRLLRIPISQVRIGGAPGVWIAQFLQPLITLPILTLVLQWRGESWSGIGLRKPADWRQFLQQTTLAMIVLLCTGYAIRHLVIAPLHLHSSGATSFSGIQNNVPVLIAALAYALLGAGLNEELQFRGFLQSRLAKALGGGAGVQRSAIVVAGLIFGLMHASLGAANVVYAALGGIVLGTIYLWADRNLWVVIILHSLFDVTRVIQFFLTGNDLP